MASGARYRLIRELGRGGMAEVFLALDRGPAGVERLVVLKRILPELAGDEQFVSMFLNEARIATCLTHPNIAHIYEVGAEEGLYFLVMEFIHGVDLDSVIRRYRKGRLRPADAVLIASKVAAALHYAHNLRSLAGKPLNLVHRDVSPQNIRISREGNVKVLDFGIAKASGSPKITQRGVLKGKFPYMSPEQVRDEAVDGRSDLFSLGVVLFEMLTYRRLFKRETSAETLEAVLEAPIPRPSEVAETYVSPELDGIVMRLLQRDPEARYQWARELEGDLEAYLRDDPATAADLEALVTLLFGEARDPRQALEPDADRVDDLVERTPSDSLPTLAEHWPPRPQALPPVDSDDEEVTAQQEILPPLDLPPAPDPFEGEADTVERIPRHAAAPPPVDIARPRRAPESFTLPELTDSGAVMIVDEPAETSDVSSPPPPAPARPRIPSRPGMEAISARASAAPTSPARAGASAARPARTDIGAASPARDSAAPDSGGPGDPSLELLPAAVPVVAETTGRPADESLKVHVGVWQTQRLHLERRGRPGLWIVLALVVAGLGGGWWLYRERAATRPAVVAAPSEREVEIRFVVEPPEATVLVDGVRQTSSVLRVPQSDATYSVTVQASGYKSRVLSVTATDDLTLRVKLVRRDP